jgi:hypothetical protein
MPALEKYDRLYDEIYYLKKALEVVTENLAYLNRGEQPDLDAIAKLHDVMTDLLVDIKECLPPTPERS